MSTTPQQATLEEVLKQLRCLDRRMGRLEKGQKLLQANTEMVRQSQVQLQQQMALIDKQCAERMSKGGCEPVAPVPIDPPEPEGNGKIEL